MFDANCGIADRSTCAAVSGMATASEPSTNALGARNRWKTKPPSAVAAISSAKPAGTNAFAPCTYGSAPCTPEQRVDRGNDRDDDQDAQALRGGDAIDARAEALAQHRHLRGAAGNAREQRRRAVRARHPRERKRGHIADGHREHRAGDQQVPESRDLTHDVRREIEPERGADDPLPAIAHRRRDADVDAGDAQEREREQRSQHPRDRRVQQRAHVARDGADGQRDERSAETATGHGDVSRAAQPLFANAEPPEDDAEQIVGGELAGDRGQRALRVAQLLGEELDRRRC